MLQIFFDSFLFKGPDKGINVFRISRNNTEAIEGFKYLALAHMKRMRISNGYS